MKKILCLLVVCIFLNACSSLLPAYEERLAEKTAAQFFLLLSEKDYAAADRLYGGDYSPIQSINPEIPPEDHASLWKNACEVNGFQCLEIRQALRTEKFSLNEFFVTVEFNNPDGSLFVLGPCCGATEEQMPPRSQFDVFIIERDGNYLVTSLPVLLP